LRKIVPLGFTAICKDAVRRYFAKCRKFEAVYRDSIEAKDTFTIVGMARPNTHKFTSHRRAPAEGSNILHRYANRPQGAIDLEELTRAGACVCSTCTGQPTICDQIYCPDHGCKEPPPDPEAIGWNIMSDYNANPLFAFPIMLR
jgi:hypothetical protein